MKVGLFFGSFNPVHHGHVMLANYLVEFSDSDALWFVVSPQNPLKNETELLDDDERLQMVQLAIGDDPRFKVCDIEFSLPKPSYTINTLTSLSSKYPDIQFVLICGMDSLQSFRRWKAYERILSDYKLLVFPRKGYDGGDLITHPSVTVLETPLIEVTSTFIRRCIGEGRDVRHFMPEKSFHYMKAHRFYEK